MKKLLPLLLLCSYLTQAQNTIPLSEGMESPNASITDVSWISGHWLGKAFGGTVEEIWSPPMGDSMMFVFRLVNEGKVSFYEIGHITEEGNSLILQLKHFNRDLSGWEEKEETVDFKLVRLEENKAYFDNFTFEKINENAMNLYVVISEGDDKKEEVKFSYQRKL